MTMRYVHTAVTACVGLCGSQMNTESTLLLDNKTFKGLHLIFVHCLRFGYIGYGHIHIYNYIGYGHIHITTLGMDTYM